MIGEIERSVYAEGKEFRSDRFAHAVTQRVDIEREYEEYLGRRDAVSDPIVLFEEEYNAGVRLATIGISVLFREILDTSDHEEIARARESIDILSTYLGIPQKGIDRKEEM